MPDIDRMREDLRRRGLPRRYVERVTAELRDHLEDLREAGRPDDELGDEDTLAATIATRARRGIAGRRPGLVFLAGPVVLWLAAIGLSLLAIPLIAGVAPEPLPSRLTPGLAALPALAAIAAAAGACLVARRRRCGWRWPLASSLLVAAAASVAHIDVAAGGAGPQLALHMTIWPGVLGLGTALAALAAAGAYRGDSWMRPS